MPTSYGFWFDANTRAAARSWARSGGENTPKSVYRHGVSPDSSITSAANAAAATTHRRIRSSGHVQFCGQAVVRTGRGLHERNVHAMNDLRRQCGRIDRQIGAEADLSQ